MLRSQNSEYLTEGDELRVERAAHLEEINRMQQLLNQNATTTEQLRNEGSGLQETDSQHTQEISQTLNQTQKQLNNLIALNNRRDAFLHHIIYREIIHSPISLLEFFHLCNHNLSTCSDDAFTIEDWNEIKSDWAHLENQQGFKKIYFEAIERNHPVEN